LLDTPFNEVCREGLWESGQKYWDRKLYYYDGPSIFHLKRTDKVSTPLLELFANRKRVVIDDMVLKLGEESDCVEYEVYNYIQFGENVRKLTDATAWVLQAY
jgi:hypothetical protein